ncbi:MAG: ImmA/IrrE family metallo-endopeptidase [Ruminococcaceae bacterium]|nr:ImmA/IrrE family metallo-endopeptidase [Oscillospiraceae bacterium]
MVLNDLYAFAEQHDIDVDCMKLKTMQCVTLSLDGSNCIIIDPFQLKSSIDEMVKLAHEIGHCVTGSFYNEYSPLDIRAKHEHRADKWAIKKLIPEDELKNALAFCINRYELSEHFGVSEDFMQKALDLYLQ